MSPRLILALPSKGRLMEQARAGSVAHGDDDGRDAPLLRQQIVDFATHLDLGLVVLVDPLDLDVAQGEPMRIDG